jgi:hypothetical protein
VIRGVRGTQAAFIGEFPRGAGSGREAQQNGKTRGVRKSTEQLGVQVQGNAAAVLLSIHTPHYFIKG